MALAKKRASEEAAVERMAALLLLLAEGVGVAMVDGVVSSRHNRLAAMNLADERKVR